MNSESSDLDAIEAAAADLDAELQGASVEDDSDQDATEEQVVVSSAAQLKTAYMALKGITGMVGSFTGIKYPPEMIEEGAEHIAPLMNKPWAQKLLGNGKGVSLIDQYHEEIQAGMWFAGFAAFTYQGVKSRRVHRSPVATRPEPGIVQDADSDSPPPVSGGVWDELANDNA